MILFIIFFIIFVYLFIAITKSKLHIDFRSLFLRGFEKKDNKFGLYCYTGKQR